MPALHATCKAADIASAAAAIVRRKLFRASLLRAYRSCALELFFQQLFLIEVGVITALPEEFIMRPALGDAPIAQDHDLVRVADRRSAVRDQNGGSPAHDAA